MFGTSLIFFLSICNYSVFHPHLGFKGVFTPNNLVDSVRLGTNFATFVTFSAGVVHFHSALYQMNKTL